MKMFRRIFALTMVIAMVCLFSASAFAVSHSDLVEFDVDTRLEAYGNVTKYEVDGYLAIDAVALQQSYLELSALYLYYDAGSNNLSSDYTSASCSDEAYCSIYRSYNGSVVREMEKATFAYYASFNAHTGEHVYNPADRTIYY